MALLLMDHLDLSDKTIDTSSEFTRLQFPVVSSFRDWTALPPELLDLIVAKLCRATDYLRFCGVCPKWRSIALESAASLKQNLDHLRISRKKLPMLLIKTEEGYNSMRGLYSIADGITYNIQLPLPCRNRFIGSSHGWLLCAEEHEVITLVNPLSNCCICLPLFKDVTDVTSVYKEPDYYLCKGILTADPHMSHNKYAVAVIYSDLSKLAIYKAGDLQWKFIDHQDFFFSDVVFYKSDIYGITVGGKLVQVDIDSGSGITIIDERNDLPDVINYLVESQEELLLVQRYCDVEEDWGELAMKPEYIDNKENDDFMFSDTEEFLRNYSSWSISSDFKVFKLLNEKDWSKWVEIDSIGEQALFLGGNQSISISTLEFPECSSNSIYFTNEYYFWVPPYKCNGPDEDSGFFNLDDKSCHSHHLLDLCEWHMKPPIWFLPNLAHLEFSSTSRV